MIKRYEPMAETVQLLDGTQEPSAEMRELKYGDWVSHEDYLSLESRHRDLVAAAREYLRTTPAASKTAARMNLMKMVQALKDESNPPGEAPK